jgi:hypothetical protein
MDDDARESDQQEDGGVDLLSVGLFVFFVALILTVGALLLVQALV